MTIGDMNRIKCPVCGATITDVWDCWAPGHPYDGEEAGVWCDTCDAPITMTLHITWTVTATPNHVEVP